MATLCTTLLLFAALAELPAGSCVLMCELKKALVAVEAYDPGQAMLEDGSWFDAYRINGRWYLVAESEPEQCWRGGASRWGTRNR
jgi:hypothetical protein